METITTGRTLTKEDLKDSTFETVSPDDLLYDCGFRQQDIVRDSQRYIDTHLRYAKSGTPAEKVQKVYPAIKGFLSDTAENPEQLARELAGLDRQWPEMQAMLYRQPALTQILLDYGYKSRFISVYAKNGPTAMALAIAYGKGFDIAGDFRWIPLNDMVCFHIVWEAICVGVRRRGAIEVNDALATSARVKEPWELALLGAGVLAPWHLQKGVPYEELAKLCHIVGVDMNVKCIDWVSLIFDPEDVQKVDATHANIPKYNISLSIENIMDFCRREENQGRFLGAHLMGVLSYYRRDPKQAKAMVAQAIRTIQDRGYLLVDLQLRTTQSKRNSVTFWLSDSLSQDEDFGSAYRFMCGICDELGLVCDVVGFSNELEEPSTVVFRLTKRKTRIILL